MKVPQKQSSPTSMSYIPLSLLAEKINVLIIGGGKAAFIKTTTFIKRGCRVTIVTKDVCDELTSLDSDCMTLIHAAYDSSCLSGFHLVVIATDDDILNQQIREDCEQTDTLYLTCSDYRQGHFVVPVMQETEQAVLALHTKSGSPRTTLFLAEKLRNTLRKYDRFIEFACDIRQQLKDRDDKDEIMNTVNSDEFFDMFMQGKHHRFCERHNLS
ncbi:hypothetical protein CSA56_06900 [candidate division KSB3 bacterium]|uniref:precorrin-2 dehydrogenase n=1 Tax=candidate division KSB3 bacterium TaxID=2044937 RepID=A0A2G6KGE1_9BACT|nr:MAG: hypothetical protein CSA56_06900 [candidate division KSB3 bacterium]